MREIPLWQLPQPPNPIPPSIALDALKREFPAPLFPAPEQKDKQEIEFHRVNKGMMMWIRERMKQKALGLVGMSRKAKGEKKALHEARQAQRGEDIAAENWAKEALRRAEIGAIAVGLLGVVVIGGILHFNTGSESFDPGCLPEGTKIYAHTLGDDYLHFMPEGYEASIPSGLGIRNGFTTATVTTGGDLDTNCSGSRVRVETRDERAGWVDPTLVHKDPHFPQPAFFAQSIQRGVRHGR